MSKRPEFPQCRVCLDGLADKAARAAVSHDPHLQARASQAARQVLAQSLEQGLRSPAIAARMLREVRRLTGVDDPFGRFKQKEMAEARRVMQELSPELPRDLRGLVSLAALGNSLDFFVTADKALKRAAGLAREGVNFHRDHLPRLQQALEAGPGLVLFFTDNAGEVYFDLPLIDHLRQQAERVVVVVKGGPAQNDLTRADVDKQGLAPLLPELADTGVDAAGIDWDQSPPQLLDLARRADLLVAKGMANYLSTLDHPLPCPGFFIFKLKCEPLRETWQAPPESYWAVWRQPGP